MSEQDFLQTAAATYSQGSANAMGPQPGSERRERRDCRIKAGQYQLLRVAESWDTRR